MRSEKTAYENGIEEDKVKEKGVDRKRRKDKKRVNESEGHPYKKESEGHPDKKESEGHLCKKLDEGHPC